MSSPSAAASRRNRRIAVVAITAAVPGPGRGRRGLQAIRDTLAAVSATIVGGEPIPVGPDFERDVRILIRDLIAATTRSAAERRL